LLNYLHEKVKWSYLKEWLKGSTAIAFGAVGNQIGAFVFILLFLYGPQPFLLGRRKAFSDSS
jgi:hypothetical protein